MPLLDAGPSLAAALSHSQQKQICWQGQPWSLIHLWGLIIGPFVRFSLDPIAAQGQLRHLDLPQMLHFCGQAGKACVCVHTCGLWAAVTHTSHALYCQPDFGTKDSGFWVAGASFNALYCSPIVWPGTIKEGFLEGMLVRLRSGGAVWGEGDGQVTSGRRITCGSPLQDCENQSKGSCRISRLFSQRHKMGETWIDKAVKEGESRPG